MMGVTHRATGLCAGACVAWGVRAVVLPAPAPVWASVVGLAGALLLTWLAGRASMWPDLDHPNSTASRELGLISGWIHEIVHAFSCAVFDFSATQADVRADDFRGHRGVSHTALAALVVGGLVGVGTWFLTQRQPVFVLGIIAGVLVGVVGTWAWAEVAGAVAGAATAMFVWTVVPHSPTLALAMVTGLLAFMATDEFLGHRYALFGGVGTAAFALWTVPSPEIDWTVAGDATGPALGAGVGLAVVTGMLAHSIGDGATKTGVPLLWPLPIRGRRYYPIHIRARGSRLHTGQSDWSEMKLRAFCWVLLGVAVVGWWPGLWTVLWELIPWPWIEG